MKITTTILVTLGLMAGTSVNTQAHCGSCAGDSHADHGHSEHEAAPDINALALVPAYLGIQEALADDNLERARKQAGGMHKALHAAGHPDAFKAIRESAFAISGAEDIAVARTAFLALSNEMITQVKALALPPEHPLFITYCPMAFGNKGAHWLQKDENVNNPYFGAQMLRCGSIKQQVGATESEDHSGHGHHDHH